MLDREIYDRRSVETFKVTILNNIKNQGYDLDHIAFENLLKEESKYSILIIHFSDYDDAQKEFILNERKRPVLLTSGSFAKRNYFKKMFVSNPNIEISNIIPNDIISFLSKYY